eukprot:1290682-Rhodomonas_salina.1
MAGSQASRGDVDFQETQLSRMIAVAQGLRDVKEKLSVGSEASCDSSPDLGDGGRLEDMQLKIILKRQNKKANQGIICMSAGRGGDRNANLNANLTPPPPPRFDSTSPMSRSHIATMVEQDLQRKLAKQYNRSSQGALCSNPEPSMHPNYDTPQKDMTDQTTRTPPPQIIFYPFSSQAQSASARQQLLHPNGTPMTIRHPALNAATMTPVGYQPSIDSGASYSESRGGGMSTGCASAGFARVLRDMPLFTFNQSAISRDQRRSLTRSSGDSERDSRASTEPDILATELFSRDSGSGNSHLEATSTLAGTGNMHLASPSPSPDRAQAGLTSLLASDHLRELAQSHAGLEA